MEMATLRKAESDPHSWMHGALEDWFPEVADLKQAIALSHVCCFWRRVALDTASLWTCPRLESDELSVSDVGIDSSWLGRAKEQPLTICSSCRPRTYRSEDSFIRLRDLVFTSRYERGIRLQHVWSTWIGRPVVIPLFGMDAPLLESLYISEELAEEPLDLPRSAPRLRTLVLDELNLRRALNTAIKSPLFPQLTRLAIGFAGCISQDKIMNALNIIERSPRLTDLAVRNVFKDSFFLQWGRDTERTPLRDKVILPLLKRLTLIGDLVVMQAVLDHVKLPEHLEIWLEAGVEGRFFPDALERKLQTDFVTRYLSHPSRIPDKLQALAASMECQDWNGNRKHFVSLQLSCSDGHRLLSLPHRGVFSYSGSLRWLCDITTALPWDMLTETRLSLGDLLPPDELLERTLRAGRLTTLHAGRSAVVRMAEIMRASLDSDSWDEPTGWLPALRILVAVGVCLEDLRSFLLAWRDVNPNRTFETLVLEGCQIDAEAVDVLLTQLVLQRIHVLPVVSDPSISRQVSANHTIS
jgi:hypothetical protein